MKKQILTIVISSTFTAIIMILGYKWYQYKEYTSDRFYPVYFDINQISDSSIPDDVPEYDKKTMPVRVFHMGFMGKEYGNTMAISLSVTTFYKKGEKYRSTDVLYECIVKTDLNFGDIVKQGDLIGIVDKKCEDQLNEERV